MHAALDVAEPLRDAAVVSNVRHESLLRQARESLARAIDNIAGPGHSPAPSTLAPETEKGPGLASGMMQEVPGLVFGMAEPASEELLLADIADARRALEEVTGKRTTEDLLRRIFEQFCIGK
jgi:tRNA U34 5-carboxymethylaminomethyl modifying GTPase MnmE/TrmE